MERTAGDAGALGESAVFPHYFKYLPDLRRIRWAHLLSVLAESEAITDIARFGEKRLKLLRRRKP